LSVESELEDSPSAIVRRRHAIREPNEAANEDVNDTKERAINDVEFDDFDSALERDFETSTSSRARDGE